jgi:hypothetical protein
MIGVYILSKKVDYRRGDNELEVLLEAARRANWDALHGPQHLRSGRFQPRDPASSVHLGGESVHPYGERNRQN